MSTNLYMAYVNSSYSVPTIVHYEELGGYYPFITFHPEAKYSKYKVEKSVTTEDLKEFFEGEENVDIENIMGRVIVDVEDEYIVDFENLNDIRSYQHPVVFDQLNRLESDDIVVPELEIVKDGVYSDNLRHLVELFDDIIDFDELQEEYRQYMQLLVEDFDDVFSMDTSKMYNFGTFTVSAEDDVNLETGENLDITLRVHNEWYDFEISVTNLNMLLARFLKDTSTFNGYDGVSDGLRIIEEHHGEAEKEKIEQYIEEEKNNLEYSDKSKVKRFLESPRRIVGNIKSKDTSAILPFKLEDGVNPEDLEEYCSADEYNTVLNI